MRGVDLPSDIPDARAGCGSRSRGCEQHSSAPTVRPPWSGCRRRAVCDREDPLDDAFKSSYRSQHGAGFSSELTNSVVLRKSGWLISQERYRFHHVPRAPIRVRLPQMPIFPTVSRAIASLDQAVKRVPRRCRPINMPPDAANTANRGLQDEAAKGNHSMVGRRALMSRDIPLPRRRVGAGPLASSLSPDAGAGVLPHRTARGCRPTNQ
jgi:hypothetical protein